MAETAIVIPIVAFLIGAIVLASLGLYRTTATDWGVFIRGVQAGDAYSSGGAATVPWADINNGIGTSADTGTKQVRSFIDVTTSKSFLFDTRIEERQTGGITFRRWGFYAGPPNGLWR